MRAQDDSGRGRTPATPPALTKEERARNLARAMEARHARSVLRRDIKAGRVRALDVIDDPVVRRMPVRELVLSLPTVGPSKAARVLAEVDPKGVHRVAGLGRRQRERLEAILALLEPGEGAAG